MLLRHLACKDERAAVKTLRGFGKAFCIQREFLGEDAVPAVRHAKPAGFWRGARRHYGSLSDLTRCPVEWSITRFPMWAAVLNYRGSARGLRLTASLRIGLVLFGGRKTADFLGDRTSVLVVSGSSTATQKCGRKPAGVLRNRSAAQNSSIDDPGQAAVT